jgi:hypothetical protein
MLSTRVRWIVAAGAVEGASVDGSSCCCHCRGRAVGTTNERSG